MKRRIDEADSVRYNHKDHAGQLSKDTVGKHIGAGREGKGFPPTGNRARQKIFPCKTGMPGGGKPRWIYQKRFRHVQTVQCPGYNQEFFETHREPLILRRAAKKTFDEYDAVHGKGCRPKVKVPNAGYTETLQYKKQNCAGYGWHRGDAKNGRPSATSRRRFPGRNRRRTAQKSGRQRISGKRRIERNQRWLESLFRSTRNFFPDMKPDSGVIIRPD